MAQKSLKTKSLKTEAPVSDARPSIASVIDDALDLQDYEMDMKKLAEAAASAIHQPETISFEMLKLLIARLAQLLAQEADYLDMMQISGVAALQGEKKALVDALEKQQKLMARRNRLRTEMSEEQEDEFYHLVEIFNLVLGENYKRLLVAKEVNAKVVEAITELANENSRQSFYTSKGQRAGDPSVSLSLNRSI